MSYMNDPREMTFDSESGRFLEQDNRHETVYQWGAMMLDLCDMPVSEYMKPMTVIGLGGGNLPEEEEVLYTVKFVIDNETVYTQELKSGEDIPFEVSGEKEERIFKGWFYGSTQYSEGSKMPSRNLTLTAKYECEVSFVFSIDGQESGVSSYTISYNSKPTKIPNTNMEGYDFMGWEPSTSSTVVKNTVFIATFKVKEYTVIWNGYDGEEIVQTYKHGDALVEPTTPLKDGYTFSKWNVDLPQTVTQNHTFTAIFTINQYTITFSEEWYGVRSELSSITMDYNSVIKLPNIPTENGYSFTEWESEYTGTTVPSYNIEYTTIKTVNSYVIAYYDNGELVKEVTYEYLSPITSFNYEKEGWTVTEWTNEPETMPYYNISAHCTSTINVYTVTFVDQNGETYIVEAAYGTLIKDIIPEIEGKTFVVDSEILNSTLGTQDLTVEGIVNVNNYKVDITVNGVSSGIEELPFGTNVRDYINEHYQAEEGYTMIIDTNYETVPANGELVVKITYKINVWKLTYSTNLGHTDIIDVEYNANIKDYLPVIEVEGYDFVSWQINDEDITDDTKMPNNDVEVIGSFAEKLCVVTVYEDDNVKFEKVYKYGTLISDVLAETVLVDYVIEQSANGYTVSYEVVNNVDTVVEDTIINVVKTPNTYILTFKNGEVIISSNNVLFGDIITYPTMENKTEDGVEYIFVWENNTYNGHPMPNMNLEIIGNYQAKSEAPIYFGGFKVAKSAYTADNTTQYCDVSMLETEQYGNVNTNECKGDGKLIEVPNIADPEMQGMTAVQKRNYLKIWTRPLSILMPCEIEDKYNIQLFNAANVDRWDAYKTDGQIVNYNGNDYYFHVLYDEETLNPVATSEVIKYTLKLIEK